MTESTDIPQPARPLHLTTSTSPSGTLAVSLRHRESDGVSSCTSSYMTQIDMRPDQWRQFIAAVTAKLDAVQAHRQIGQPATDLAGRIAEIAGAT